MATIKVFAFLPRAPFVSKRVRVDPCVTDVVQPDERRFIDQAAMTRCVGTETAVIAGDPAAAGLRLKGLLLVRRRPDHSGEAERHDACDGLIELGEAATRRRRRTPSTSTRSTGRCGDHRSISGPARRSWVSKRG
jgi:hypothetical protein